MKRRFRVFRVTRSEEGCRTIWLCVGGHKPLAHLPRWRRRLLHLPSIRWRVWPRPWDQGDSWGPRCREYQRHHRDTLALRADGPGHKWEGSE